MDWNRLSQCSGEEWVTSRRMRLATYQAFFLEENRLAHSQQSARKSKTKPARGLSFEEKIASAIVNLKITKVKILSLSAC